MMMNSIKYQGVDRLGRNCRGITLVCNFGYHHLACKPEHKPDDPWLQLPLMEFWTCNTLAKQFLSNLHQWKNDFNVIAQLFSYLKNDESSLANYNKQQIVDYIALQLEQRQLLIFPIDDKKALFNNRHLTASSNKSAKPLVLASGNKVVKASVPFAEKTIPNTSSARKEKVKPAQSINEAEQRIEKAKEKIVAARNANKPLPQSPYTLADKQAIVKNGLKENILVRVIETAHSTDTGTIGQVKNGRSLTWTAPMSQVEHADSDAELLLNAFGTRYDPNKSYTMLLIDQEKMANTGDVVSIIPTFENLTKMIADNPDMGIEAELAVQVLNDDFAPKYEAFAKQGRANGTEMNDDEAIKDLAQKMGLDSETAKLLSKRHQIAKDISAWEIFTGNGMTRDTNVSDMVAYGPVEVFSYDKQPQQLGKLESAEIGAIKRIKLD
jgi:hypothetical protein